MVEVPLGWKLSIQGAEEVKARLDDINNQLRQGIAVKKEDIVQVRQQIRDYRFMNQNLQQSKQLFLATHPAIQSFSQAMSVAGRVSHSLMSIVNTLNLANLALGQSDNTLAQDHKDLAEAQIALIKAYQSGDPNKIAEAQKKLGDAQQKLADDTRRNTDQMRQNWVTFGATAIFTASTVTQSMIQLATTSRGAAFLAGTGMILAFVSGFYSSIFLVTALSPVFAKNVIALMDGIKKAYNVDGLTAFLLLPWIAFQLTVYDIWDKMTGAWADFVNTVRVGINPLIQGFNALEQARATITGTKAQLAQEVGYATPTHLVKELRFKMQNPNVLTGPAGTTGGPLSQIQDLIKMIQSPTSTSTNNPLFEAQLEDAKKTYQNTLATITQTNSVKASNEVTHFLIGVNQTQVDATQTLSGYTQTSNGLTVTLIKANTAVASQVNKLATEGIKVNIDLTRKGAVTKATATLPETQGDFDYDKYGFGGLRPNVTYDATGHPHITYAQHGFEGMVTKPTMFLAGESGSEHISIRPIGKGSSGGQPMIVQINVAGSIWSTRDLQQMIDDYFKTRFKGLGYG